MRAETTHHPEGNGDRSLRTITEKEFCSLVGISVSTALALRKANKLAHCRCGRRVLYIYPRHVAEFLAAAERKSA